MSEAISDVPASLADILADARQNSQAVTAVNVTDERRLDVVESYLDRFDVPVRERALDAPTPADFAVLHQGSEYVAGASLAELAAAITVERSGADSFSERSYPELLTYVDQSVFTADGAWREQLVQTSRHVEMLAWRHGRGELHAGFQQLSRMRDAYGTREVYEKIAERDVDVHVYGNPDLDRPLADSFTVHGSEAAEIRDTWFAVFVDGANPSRAGTLIAEERDQGRYHGFWSFDPAVGAVARRYVVDSYGADSPE